MAAELKIAISADVQSAISGFDKLLAKANQLEKIGAIEVPVSLDTSNVKFDKSEFQNEVKVPVGLETSGIKEDALKLKTDPIFSGLVIPVKADVQEAIASVDKLIQKLFIAGDISPDSLKEFSAQLRKLDQELSKAVDPSDVQRLTNSFKVLAAQIANTGGIDLNVEDETGQIEGLKASVNSLVSTLDKKIELKFNTDSFQGSLQNIKRVFDAFSTSVGIDTSDFDAAFKRITDKIGSLQDGIVNMTLNKGQVDAAVEDIKKQILSIQDVIAKINVNDTPALQKINGLEKLLSSLEGDVTIDSGNIRTQVDKLKALVGSINIPIDSDTTEIDAAIKNIITKLDLIDDRTIGIDVNGEPAKRIIESVLSDLSKLRETGVVIKADASPALKTIDLIEKEIRSIQSNVTITAPDLQEKVRLIKQQFDSLVLTADIKGDPTELNNTLKDIRNKLSSLEGADFNITANKDQALKAISEVFTAINTLKSTNVQISADSSRALSVIDAVETELKSLSALISLDPSAFQTQVQKLKAQFDDLVFNARIKGDAADFDAVVKAIQQKFAVISDPTINLHTNQEEIRGAIKFIFDNLQLLKNTQIDLGIDSTETIEFLKQLQTQLGNLEGEVTIDNSDLQQTFARINQLIDPLKDPIELKITAREGEALLNELRKRLEALRGTDIVLDINGQTVITTINLIEKELTQLEQKLKLATDPKEILALNKALLQVRDSIKSIPSASVTNTFRSVSGASSQATFALTNMGRVLQDLPFGLIGIANNITPLVESFQRLSQESKETGTSLGKNLLNSLKGGGGLILAVSALTSVLQFATLGLTFFTRGLSGTKKDVDAAASSIDRLTSRLQDLKNGLENLKFNVGFRNDLKKFQAEAAGIEGEELDMLGLRSAIESNDILINKIDDQISVLGKKINTFNAEVAEAKKNFVVTAAVEGDQIANQIRNPIEKIISTYKDFATIPQSVIESLSKADQAVLKSAINVNNELSALLKQRDDIQNQSALNQLKILISQQKQIEKIQDDTIARARQFVKEFGEVFIVPDLEDGFFRTKKELFSLSKKLLDDVAAANLQIKLPFKVDIKETVESIEKDINGVITNIKFKRFVVPVISEAEFQFVPPDANQLRVEITKEIESAFLSVIRSEKRDIVIPVEGTIDLSLPQTREAVEKFDRLMNGFFQLGTLGRKAFESIDFTNFNAGLEEGIIKLQNLQQLAQTLQQSIGQGLSNAFNDMFDAALEGKNVIKALGNAVKELVVQTIKAVAQMLILKAVSSALGLPSIGGGGGLLGGLLGGLGGTANLNGLGQQIASVIARNPVEVIVTGNISGDNIRLSGQRSTNSAGRFG